MERDALTSEEFRARSYFPTLDAIRAVAVLSVVGFHVRSDVLRGLQGGRGVTWFFVLSGFLITTLALREEERRGAVDLRAFLVRRAFRILPLYALALAAFVVLDVVVFRSQQAISGWAANWPYYLTMMQDVPMKLGWNAPFEVSWSLGVEEKFYLVWPLVGFAVMTSTVRLRVTAAFTAGLAVMLLVFDHSMFSKLVGSYVPILVGCVVAMLLHDRRVFALAARGARPAVLVVLSALVVIPQPGWIRSMTGFGIVYACVIGLTVGGLALVPRLPRLGGSALLWVGRRSYGIYLFHACVIRVVEKSIARTPLDGEVAAGVVLIVSLAGSLVVADVLHRVVEQPLVAIGRNLAGRRRREGAPAVVGASA